MAKKEKVEKKDNQRADNDGQEVGQVVWSMQNSSRNGGCWFCEYQISPDYKDTEILSSFLSPRGKILSKQITGTCSSDQRKLSQAIKLARHMALLR